MVSLSKYILTAGTATIVDIAVVQACLSFGHPFGAATLALVIALGAAAGIGVNFILSRRFVFRSDGRPAAAQFRSFLAVSASTALLRMLVAYLLTAIFALPAVAFILALPVSSPADRLAHLGAVGLVTIYSFLAHCHISFAGGLRHRLRIQPRMVP